MYNDIHDDIDLHSKNRCFQNTGQLLMLVFVSLALLGFTGGGGFLNTTVIKDFQHFQIKYERFGRRMTPLLLAITVNFSLIQQPELMLWINHEYFQNMEIQQIIPTPKFIDIKMKMMVFHFSKYNEDSSMIYFYLRPRKAGPLKGWIRVGEIKKHYHFSQFIYP
jgi:hypothetical protein